MKGNFIILEKESLEKFEEANRIGVFKNLNPAITEADKIRIGFYFLVLENVTGIDNLKDISDMIIDTDYIRLTQSVPNKADLGVDAYYIENGNGETVINLFNFKYRETYALQKKFTEKDAIATKKFLHYISDGGHRSKNLEGNPTYEHSLMAIKKIRKVLDDTNKAVKRIYFISNDTGRPRENEFEECEFQESYEVLNSKDIVDLLSKAPNDASALFQVSQEHTICYKSEDGELQKTEDGGLGKSYVFVVPLYDLVRITCNIKYLRQKAGLEKSYAKKLLNTLVIDENILGDNVRNYLGRTKYNEDIVDTLKKDSDRNFFAYNNGITIIADSVEARSNDGSSKYTVTLDKFQIVNGGQTLNSIYKYIQTCNDSVDKVLEVLDNNFVLMRAYSVGEVSPEGKDKEIKYSLGAKIAKYTNSQNAIKPADLHANDSIQISLHYYLKDFNYYYIRKSGETNIPTGYKSVSMELVAQILMAVLQGEPGKASNNKSSLFKNEYRLIFDNSLDFRFVKEYIDFYFVVSDYYEKKKVKSIQRKLYTMYIGYSLKNRGKDKPVEYLESFLDSALENYAKDRNKDFTYRSLISVDFKKFIDGEINQEINKP